jgi:hypothetical protein
MLLPKNESYVSHKLLQKSNDAVIYAYHVQVNSTYNTFIGAGVAQSV